MSSAHRPRARPLGCRFLPKTVRGLSCKCRVMAQPGRAVHRPAAPLTGLVRPFSGVLRVSAVQVYFSIQSGFHPECRGSNWNCLQNRWCEGVPIGADWDPPLPDFRHDIKVVRPLSAGSTWAPILHAGWKTRSPQQARRCKGPSKRRDPWLCHRRIRTGRGRCCVGRRVCWWATLGQRRSTPNMALAPACLTPPVHVQCWVKLDY
jgi:hypothetical protein